MIGAYANLLPNSRQSSACFPLGAGIPARVFKPIALSARQAFTCSCRRKMPVHTQKDCLCIPSNRTGQSPPCQQGKRFEHTLVLRRRQSKHLPAALPGACLQTPAGPGRLSFMSAVFLRERAASAQSADFHVKTRNSHILGAVSKRGTLSTPRT